MMLTSGAEAPGQGLEWPELSAARCAPSMYEVMTTRSFSPRERLGFWNDVICRLLVPKDVVLMRSDEEFYGTVAATDIGQLSVADVASIAQDFARTPSHLANESSAMLQIALMERGRGWVSQDGREAHLEAGDFAIYESTRPFLWSVGTSWDCLVFTLPRTAVALTEAESRLITARRFAGDYGLSGLVSRFLRDVARTEDLIGMREPERVVGNVVDLVLSLVTDELGRSDTIRSSVQRSLMTRIKVYIQQNLADPELTPAAIAAAHHISVRYLHKLFANEGPSVAEYVRNLRIERCRRDFLDLRLATRSVAQIAQRWGFGDISGFNRAFKAAVGATPRDYRNARPVGAVDRARH
jgi:AraC-like DNA-binding protein